MKKRTKFSLAGLGLIGAGSGLAFWAAANWKSDTDKLVEKLKQSAAASEEKTISFKGFGDLPAPVARYFRFALKEGQPLVRTAQIRHKGEFNLNDEWIPFDSTEHFSAQPPGFIWDADMRMNQLINVRVRDGYLSG